MSVELSEFARQVLFGERLEEKLECPVEIVDFRPGAAMASPAAPGRPAELRFKAGGSGVNEFPGVNRLAEERDRGLLLHFMANHELLATELMALVLLRFPDAPPAFRSGVLATLKEEQMHTRLYLRRMRECGIEFGEVPVSGYFWRMVADMEEPMDFVARLSLTFEQANLDYCRQYSDAFKEAGDEATARLLERIYRDEIGHVAHGLKWVRRWKRPGESDWDAFCRQLKFPLSPARAKGICFNAAGRQAAGLDRDFVDRLNVYSHSRGRTPGVFVFNPFAESVIARGRGFHPVKSQVLLLHDLGGLVQYLCRADDVVLIGEPPSVKFLSGLKEAGFPLPEFVRIEEGRIDPGSSLGCRKLGKLRPWAWAPDSIDLLKPLFPLVTVEGGVGVREFGDGLARLYSKGWGARFLKGILKGLGDPGFLCGEEEVGEEVRTEAEALLAIARTRGRGHWKVVVKEPLGTAGHNMIRLWEPELLATQLQWIRRTLKSRGSVVIEPWLERVMDFSVQLEMGSEGLRIVGFTGLLNDAGGQFQGCLAGPHSARRLPEEPVMLFAEGKRRLHEFYDLYRGLLPPLEAELRRAGHTGPVGIDALIYRDAAGRFRVKPIVEINPRHTLGRLTLELMRRVRPGRHGLFRLLNRSMIREEGFSDFGEYARHLAKRAPLRMEGSPVSRIDSGAICLNDPDCAKAYLGVFQVERLLRCLPSLTRIQAQKAPARNPLR